MSQTIFVPVGYALTMTAPANSNGGYWLVGNPGDQPGDVIDLNAGASATVGPFNTPRKYYIFADNGEVVISIDFSGAYDATGDKSDEAATYEPLLSGAALTGATVAVDDYVLIQDKSNSNNLKTVSAQSIADLVVDSVTAAALQSDIDDAQSDATQALSDASDALGASQAAQSDATQALSDASDAQGDATQALSDASDAQDGADASVKIVNVTNVGVVNTGTTATEHGDGFNNTTILTVNTVLPAIAGGEDLSVGKLLYTLPAGAIVINSAYMSMGITQTEANIDADTPDVGLGTSLASGANALLSDGMGTENLLTGQTAANCTGTATLKTVADQVLVIEAGADHTVYLNAADGWAADGDAAAILAGTVVIHWKFMH